MAYPERSELDMWSLKGFVRRIMHYKKKRPTKARYKNLKQTDYATKARLDASGSVKVMRDESQNKIQTHGLNPYVAEAALEVITEARKAGLRVDIFEGFRSFKRQKYLYEVKKTTKARPGHSWHNYGLACDIVFKTNTGKWTWEAKPEQWRELGKIGKRHGFEWGGDWGWDFAHFELHDEMTISLTKKLYHKGGQKKVWEYYNRLKLVKKNVKKG